MDLASYQVCPALWLFPAQFPIQCCCIICRFQNKLCLKFSYSEELFKPFKARWALQATIRFYYVPSFLRRVCSNDVANILVFSVESAYLFKHNNAPSCFKKEIYFSWAQWAVTGTMREKQNLPETPRKIKILQAQYDMHGTLNVTGALFAFCNPNSILISPERPWCKVELFLSGHSSVISICLYLMFSCESRNSR